MPTGTTEPIPTDWTINAAVEERAATASGLAAAIGVLTIADVHRVAPDLSRAVAELAAVAGRGPLVDHDDPLVTQVRALGILSTRHPSATSPSAAELLDRLTAAVAGSPVRRVVFVGEHDLSERTLGELADARPST